jgi:hypothetical protein
MMLCNEKREDEDDRLRRDHELDARLEAVPDHAE